MPSNTNSSPCSFFQTGHCREMGKSCTLFHGQETCWKQECDRVTCVDRHPNLCTSFRDYGACFWKTCSYRHARPFFRPPHQEQTDCHTVLITNDATLYDHPPDQILKQLQEKLTSNANEIQILTSSIGGLETQIEQLNKLIQNIPAPPASCGCGEKLTELSNKYISKEETDNARHSSIEQ
jgi:hypothetical protein